ncbi:hypothetical protein A3736_13375 [Erythrobacter sp. HI0063]|jgi:hypothetical protein|uniref:hypothetical protein n=1 Tax=Erythrobacter sp. HI0063 TaxID=1822240 RepID=UPI0007C230DA|nr:hypothetical protein [Erythrobacter sp. HI0063]KZY54742.1 hypothetical protein A3736_13375 [Erythrobacter sp. HI0063]
MMSLLASAAASLALAAQPAPPATEAPQLSLEQATGLRCGVAFALVAQGQQAGDPAALAYPAMNPRGKEFFVRFMAALMEDPRFSRDLVTSLAMRETQELARGGPEALSAVMPACLQLLDLSGL